MRDLGRSLLALVLLTLSLGWTNAGAEAISLSSGGPASINVSYFSDIRSPEAVTLGPDGNVWFLNGDGIGKITPGGMTTVYAIPDIGNARDLTAGPDGNVWFTTNSPSAIGLITPDGVVTTFGHGSLGFPYGITAGPDGNLWFTNGDKIGRVTPAGQFSSFSDSAISGSFDIISGPDGNIWFSNLNTGTVAKITTAGVVTAYNGTGISGPTRLSPGPEGNVWFVNQNDGSVAKITPAGTATSYQPVGMNSPYDLTSGADGNIWFTDSGPESGPTTVSKLTTSGVLTPYPSSFSEPGRITTGSGGNLWITIEGTWFEGNPGSLNRVTPAGVLTGYEGGTVDRPTGIASDPDGSVWFKNSGGSVGRTTSSGETTRLDDAEFTSGDITRGPDGNFWMTNTSGHSISRVTPDGAITTYTDPSIAAPTGISTGPDGNLWFTNQGNNNIGSITPQGIIGNYTDPSIDGPQDIVSGSDGALWFTNYFGNTVGRVTTGGQVTEFTDATISGPYSISSGPDGNLWFTNAESDSIGRISPAGIVQNYSEPSVSQPMGIAAGPDGALWFTNTANDSLGRITTDGTIGQYLDAGMRDPVGIVVGSGDTIWFTNSGSTYDSIAVFSVPIGPPGTVTQPQVTPGDERASLTWDPADPMGSPITGYEAETNNLTASTTETETLGTPIAHDATGLTNGNSYRFRIRAENANGLGEWSEWSATIVPSGLPGPTGTPTNTPAQDQISTTWGGADPNGTPVTGHRVEYENLDTAVVATLTTGASTTQVITDLVDGHDYRVRVRAQNENGYGPWSAWSSTATIPCITGFPDVPGTHPFCSDIAWAVDQGYTNGYPDGTYRPTVDLSRGEMAAFLYRQAGEPAFTPPGTPTFNDVGTGHHFYAEIEWAASEGITEGFGDGGFHPTGKITRQALAAFLYRAAGEPAFTPPGTPSFNDVGNGHLFYLEIEWLASTEITEGFGDGGYHPAAEVTRQAMAAFLCRYDRL